MVWDISARCPTVYCSDTPASWVMWLFPSCPRLLLLFLKVGEFGNHLNLKEKLVKTSNFEKPENQSKYGFSYWKLSGNEKFAPSNCSALTRPHITCPVLIDIIYEDDQEYQNVVSMNFMNVPR